MLGTLSLSSFALIDSVTITFDRGFHILTGETGAGKTLLIQAIHLLTGHKVSTDIIRKGTDKAVIEATFDIKDIPEVQKLLTLEGIDFDPSELLIIKREISRHAKNRIFINAQFAPLSLLAQIGPHLLELVSQNSAQTLRQPDTQRSLLDLYGNTDLAPYSQAFHSAKALEKELTSLKMENAPEKLDRLKWELKEWEALSYQEGEEDTLFSSYKSLATSQEEVESLAALQAGLDHPNLIPTLSQFQKLTKDPSLKEHLQSAIMHLQEASFMLSKNLESLDHSPDKLKELEERLSRLNHLKRKYHVEAILPHLENLRKQVDTLEHLDERTASLEKQWQTLKDTTQTLAQTLTEKRLKEAQELEKALTEELRALNFSQARVIIEVTPQELGPTGKDRVTFFLAANPGEAPSSLATHSSGGEIARFLFALKLLYAGKGGLPTLIFDEIDANVGGETASLLGKKLKALAQSAQVLAITHFPQVARHADHHLQISKHEVDGRTLTEISPLQTSEKERELLRMLGGESLNLFPK
ncbi:MAG: DNA repair protein RecN [Chlamydiia bacterium]|nr:DNA repair protein RecN [Chlamydiia bacterium]